MAETDLLIIISGSQVFVREVKTVFLVGQECPKIEVPPPTSKTAMQFQKDFLLVRQHTRPPALIAIPGITRECFVMCVVSAAAVSVQVVPRE